MKRTFGDDINFLENYTDVIVLKSPDGQGQILVLPEYQGRVMTSSLAGEAGAGFGWINYEKIESQQPDPKFNAYGGEDRFWLGPEGGQFSLYHRPGKEFNLENWFVPKQIDAEPFNVLDKSDREVIMESDFSITNYSGTEFDVKIKREVRIFTKDQIWTNLGLSDKEGLEAVGFESENHLINDGDSTWSKSDGLLSIWILGMYNPGDEVVIVLPYYEGGTGSLGEIVNDDYFGKVPPERIKIGGGVIFFKGDGKHRSKIGLNWMRAKNVLGSYDPERKLLTIVKYNKPDEKAEYVKSMWEIMDDPYEGDVVNSYNDGVPDSGGDPLGPFYELETSSPVRELAPGEEIRHVHQTYHISGEEDKLSQITEELFGINIQKIKDAFAQ